MACVPGNARRPDHPLIPYTASRNVKPVLYLVHRMPYPPNKGDKIRSFHILRFLAQRYRVHLGTFIDSENDRAFVRELSALCAETFVLPLSAGRARLKSLRGLATGAPLTIPYYFQRPMQTWVDGVLAERRIDRAVVFSSSMAQYVSGSRYGHVRRIMDFVDVDSEKWRQYGTMRRWPWSWVYAREARALLEYEAKIALEFDRSVFVSEPEAAHFRALAPASAHKIHHLENGVDYTYFDPSIGFENPYRSEEKAIVFTGAMDYWANVDAVTWFAAEVLPLIRRRVESARFYIVGSDPVEAVRALAGDEIVVTGRVPDVRPYLAHAAVDVAPLRIARGIQNKVLEAMAMGCAVVATAQAAEGIAARDRELTVASEPSAMADAIVRQIEGSGPVDSAERARTFVTRRYDWTRTLAALESWLECDR